MTLKPGGYFFLGAVMKYDKPALSIPEQAQQLIERGLICENLPRLHHYLGHIGYYRLSAYWLPFELPPVADNGSRNHRFAPDTTFQGVLDLYLFDRKLRLLVMEAIERIEVAIRTLWANALGLRYGSHAHMKPELFRSPWQHAGDIAAIASALEKSREVFVVHYRKNYKDPFLPPIWAVVETLTLGALSCWLERTNDNKAKQEVAKEMGLPTIDMLEKVLHTLTLVRNICAHHGRLWNRRFVIQLPHIKKLGDQIEIEHLIQSDGSIQKQPSRKLYNYLVIMIHLMRRINPRSRWRERLRTHVASASRAQQQAMGFPDGWETRDPWL